MTDAQLSILLYQYSTRLAIMIDAVEAVLPDDVKEERTSLSLSPPDYKRTWLECAHLDGLRQFVQELKQDSEVLELAAKDGKPQPR